MKILVVGNQGYVGPVLGRHLRATTPGLELAGFDAGYFALSLTGAAVWPELPYDRQIAGDVRDLSAATFAGFDAVVYLAAISNDPMGARYEAVTDAVNRAAALRAAELAAGAGVRSFVFASSCSVYG